MYSKYDEAQFHLRLPHELHAKIKQRAKMNNRSLNSEIIAAIEESLAKQSLIILLKFLRYLTAVLLAQFLTLRNQNS